MKNEVRESLPNDARFGLGAIDSNDQVIFKEYSRDIFASQIHAKHGNPTGRYTFRYIGGTVNWSDGVPGKEQKDTVTTYLERRGFPVKRHTSFYEELGPPDDDLDESMFPKGFNRHALGTCMSAAAHATSYLIGKGITNFKVVEGFVQLHPSHEPEDEAPHTWIEFENGRKFDPTKKQWKNWGYDPNTVEYKKIVKTFTPQEYLILCRTQGELNESPDMSLHGKRAMAGDKPLKSSTVAEVKGNIVLLRNKDAGFFAVGATWIFFMDSEQSAEDMKNGKLPYLLVPRGTFHSGGSPITDIWKKKFQKPGTEHILGVLEGHSDEKLIYVDMLTVRPGWHRNSIATKMMKALKYTYPKAELRASSATDKGAKFLAAYKKANNIPEGRRSLKKMIVEMVKQVFNEIRLEPPVDSPIKEGDSPEELKIIQSRIPHLTDDTVFITVNRNDSLPESNYVQVDEISNGKNWFSSNPETMTKLGYKLPSSQELLQKLPRGRYSVAQLKKASHMTEAFANKAGKHGVRGMTYDELLKATTPERIEKAKHNIRVRSIPVSVEEEQERWNFKYRSDRATGDPGDPLEGHISFVQGEVGPNDNALKLECVVECSCPDFMYRFAYNDASKGASRVGRDSLSGCINRKPKPAYDYGVGLCKHLSALSRYLRTKISSTRKSNLFEAVGDVAKQGPFTVSYND